MGLKRALFRVARHWLVPLVVGSITMLGILSSAIAQQVIHRQDFAPDDRRNDYLVALLEALFVEAPDASDAVPFTLVPLPHTVGVTPERFHKMLITGELGVIWAPYNPRLEREAIPLHKPLMRGLLEYRVFLIDEQRQAEFAQVQTLQDLRTFTLGQATGWEDIAVYEANGVEVITSSAYERLFPMLMRNRFDFFSRGITEIEGELAAYGPQLPGLHMEQTLAVQYPFPVFLYVSAEYPDLAPFLEQRLEAFVASGQFDHLWNQHFDAQTKAILEGRWIFRLSNPLLPTRIPYEVFTKVPLSVQ